jgi:Ca2+-binding RTX toxin-like protein
MAIIYGKANATIYGTRFSDQIFLSGKSVVYGGAGNDEIEGSSAANRIYGQDGDDTINSNGGLDTVWGGGGNDTLLAPSEIDPVRFYGDSGADILRGSFGDDYLDGGAGDDYLMAMGGRDSLRGGIGNDTLVYGDDKDIDVYGVSTFSGGDGHDILSLGVHGNDADQVVEVRMTGESRGNLGYSTGIPNDDYERTLDFTGINEIRVDTSETTGLIYFGGDSDNTVTGGYQDDILIGGMGSETFSGGDGNDQFMFRFLAAEQGNPGELAMGHDRITDFSFNADGNSDFIGILDGNEFVMNTTQTEHDGVTTYTSTDDMGHVIHILDVEAVGLPPLEFVSDDWWVA